MTALLVRKSAMSLEVNATHQGEKEENGEKTEQNVTLPFLLHPW